MCSYLYEVSNAPSCTEIKCYWTAPILSTVRNIKLPVSCYNKKQKPPTFETSYKSDGTFLEEVKMKMDNLNGPPNMLLKQLKPLGQHVLSMHRLVYEYARLSLPNKDSAQFLNYASCEYTAELILSVARQTVQQSECPIWNILRFGRVTASIFNAVAVCSTIKQEELLIMKMFGAIKLHQSFAMGRGLAMEKPVLETFAIHKKCKISPGYLQMSSEYPHFAASPDGVAKDFVVEVKSPEKNSNITHFLNKNGKPAKHVLLQILLQMKLCDKKIGYLLIPDEEFLTNDKYTCVDVNLDCCSEDDVVRSKSLANKKLLEDSMASAQRFWEEKVFPKLIRPMRPIFCLQ